MTHNHLVDHVHHKVVRHNNTLYVIGIITNPLRFHSRYRLFRQWMREMENTPNVQLCVVEAAFGDREFEVTESGNRWHLQIRTRHELWHKENMINLAIRHLLPVDWKYVCWSDGDIHFRNRHWAQEAIHQMQHYHLIQPWSDCADLGPNGEILQHHKSFCAVHRTGQRKQQKPWEPYKYAHSGYAWCCTRFFYENIGKLMDFCILGSADHHMAWGAIGLAHMSMPHRIHGNYRRRVMSWQDDACRVTHGDDVGYVTGSIEHHFHGSKNKRYYQSRWQILLKHDYDPDKDLCYDDQGLIYITGKPALKADIKAYLRSRCEDSIDP